MASFELELRREFAAAHRIRLPDGSLEPLHGHNWVVEVIVAGDALDPSTGMLADFVELQEGLKRVIDSLHNTCLNDLAAFESPGPSTECVARHIHDQFAPSIPESVRVRKVRVWETGQCAAVYLPDGGG